MEHAADHKKQERPADTDDDRRNVTIPREATAFREVSDDAGDDNGAEEGEKHERCALQLLSFGEREAPQEDVGILRAFSCTLQAQELHRTVAAGHG